jgi:hypothetical protein
VKKASIKSVRLDYRGKPPRPEQTTKNPLDASRSGFFLPPAKAGVDE